MKIPKKINLANIPTPLTQIEYNGYKFFIKRDDLTGLELTGNKVRKLEYLLYDAIKKKADYIFTSGGDQSNHARAACIAANSSKFSFRYTYKPMCLYISAILNFCLSETASLTYGIGEREK